MLLRSCCACLSFNMRVVAKQLLGSKPPCHRRSAAAVSSVVMLALLQAQEISLNFHCKCEQYVQFASGSFFNFNGTAGETASLILTTEICSITDALPALNLHYEEAGLQDSCTTEHSDVWLCRLLLLRLQASRLPAPANEERLQMCIAQPLWGCLSGSSACSIH